MAVERLVRAAGRAMAALTTGTGRAVAAAAHLISRSLKAIGRAVTSTGGGVCERIRRVTRGARPGLTWRRRVPSVPPWPTPSPFSSSPSPPSLGRARSRPRLPA
jgi:hypothetical protein